MTDLERLGLPAARIAKDAPRDMVTLAPYRLARFPATKGECWQFLAQAGHGARLILRGGGISRFARSGS